MTAHNQDEVLKLVPLNRLKHLPPDSVEPELATLRARKAEQERAKLARQLSAERAEKRQLEEELEVLTAQSHLIEQLDDTRRDLYETYEVKGRYSGGDATAILVLTDWHCEEKVDPETINGLNEFNLEIASERVKNCTTRFLALLDSVRSLSNVRKVVIAVLGDMITGHLHPDQREENYLSPTEALIFARDHLHSAIDTIVAESGVEEVDVHTSFGNHGRTTDKPRVSTSHKHSYEYLLYEWMARDYQSNPRVNWRVVKSYFNMAEIEGKRVRFHHGDEIRFNGGVGGITIPVMKAIRNWDDGLKSDLDVFGHWHQFMWNPKFVACNCLIGYNAYAQRRVKAAFSHPSQTFILIDKNRPGAVDVREVFCD